MDLRSEGELPGIHLRPVAVRVYPEHTLAAHTLGFVAGDAQEGSKGYYGIEGFYDKALKGRSGLRKGDGTRGWHSIRSKPSL